MRYYRFAIEAKDGWELWCVTDRLVPFKLAGGLLFEECLPFERKNGQLVMVGGLEGFVKAEQEWLEERKKGWALRKDG